MCGKSFPSVIHQSPSDKNQVKICSTCTYHNSANAKKCLICKTSFGSRQKDVLNKVCPFCNHDNEPGVACTQCTFENSIGAKNCVVCDSPLQSSSYALDDSTDSFEEDDYSLDDENDLMEDDLTDNADDFIENALMDDSNVEVSF